MATEFGFGYSSNTDWDSFSEQAQRLLASLPHGSGIDYDWSAEQLKNGKVKAYNAYHGMNDGGMYVCSVDFCLTFDPADPDNFRLTFSTNSTGRYWIENWDLRSYLEDTIAYCFSEA